MERILAAQDEATQEQYHLSLLGRRFLERLVDEDLKEVTITSEDAKVLARGVASVRGEATGNELDREYEIIFESLFSPNGSAETVADAMGVERSNNTYMMLRSLREKCEEKVGPDMTLDGLMFMGDPEYEPKISRGRARQFGRVAKNGILSDDRPHQVEAITQRDVSDYPSDKPLAWQDDGLCAQTDPELFFPEKGGSTKGAKKICAQCEVKNICLQYAVETGQSGIWGGMSDQERRKLKKSRTNAA
jgi:WhiB family redox-sensing transcriptional regulator